MSAVEVTVVGIVVYAVEFKVRVLVTSLLTVIYAVEVTGMVVYAVEFTKRVLTTTLVTGITLEIVRTVVLV